MLKEYYENQGYCPLGALCDHLTHPSEDDFPVRRPSLTWAARRLAKSGFEMSEDRRLRMRRIIRRFDDGYQAAAWADADLLLVDLREEEGRIG